MQNKNPQDRVKHYEYKITFNQDEMERLVNGKYQIWFRGEPTMVPDGRPFVFHSTYPLTREEVENMIDGTKGVKQIIMPVEPE